MSADPHLREVVNAEQRRRRTPFGRCEQCGGTRHLVPLPAGTVRCYEHLEGASASVEIDHPAGWREVGGLLVALYGNAHRDVTEIRRALGIDDWPAVDGDPLVALSYVLAGLGTLLLLVAHWVVEYVEARRAGEPPPRFPIVL